jgi:hypothetical protein
MTTFSTIEKFDVSLEFDAGVTLPDETELILAFHTLIQGQSLDDTLIDVANYLHVTTGPGILLIGHKAFRAVKLDQVNAGISVSGRRFTKGADTSFLQQHVFALVEFGKALEAYFKRDLFKSQSLTVRLNDRRYQLNDYSPQGLLASVDEDLRGLGLDLSKLGLRESDPREQLAIDVVLREPQGLSRLRDRPNTKDQAA